MAAHMPAAAAILASIAATAHCISALLLSREKKYRACAKNGWLCGRASAGAACECGKACAFARLPSFFM